MINTNIMKNKQKPNRQGDVLILPINEIPTNLVETKKCTLALGEATGHHHTIFENAVGYSNTEDGLADYFEVTDTTADLVHQEHDTIPIPKGKYRKVIQSEFTPEEIKHVID
jgi:hypothetical protein|tara:strand:- start:1186 stop:1521 length:336 start_codon:yes stop_codon:yes gene_type:complete